jgi:endonuclease I
MIYVQIPSSFRSDFGLDTNPSFLGEKMKVTGTLPAYFSHAGLKNGTAFEKLGEGTITPDPEPTTPIDASVNSSRSNLDFDNGGTEHSEVDGNDYDSDSWEPRDSVKGDVARTLFYMAVLYEGDSGELDLESNNQVNNGSAPYHGKLSVLLQWHKEDPVDDFERERNEVIYTDYQQNRNPFSDHPEWVSAIWE